MNRIDLLPDELQQIIYYELHKLYVLELNEYFKNMNHIWPHEKRSFWIKHHTKGHIENTTANYINFLLK